jgi:MraZ protein
MNHWVGNYQHTIDAKGRLFLPAKHREGLSEVIYMTRGLSGCIFLFSEQDWFDFIDQLGKMNFSEALSAQRYFAGNAGQSEIDSQGRIIIPQNLRKFANLEKDVTVVGLGNRLEIWDTTTWDNINNEITNDKVSEVLSKMNFKL